MFSVGGFVISWGCLLSASDDKLSLGERLYLSCSSCQSQINLGKKRARQPTQNLPVVDAETNRQNGDFESN